MRKKFFILFIACAGLMMSFAVNRRASYKIKTVVIDAGHGGHDHGCKGATSKEKDLTLKIALKLGKQIEENHPDVKVIYTRKSDVFVELHERAEIANRAKADLFICIHINAGSKVAQGTETYVMGLHKSEDNLAVSKRENESILLEKDYKTQYGGYDPNSPESNIIFSLYQNTYRDKSLIFASKVQYQFRERAKRFDRGVKEAGFIVLWHTAMPSVLIECGFLSNPREEKFLVNDKSQDNLATSIYEAFKEYKIDMEEGDQAAMDHANTVTTYEHKTLDEANEEKNKTDTPRSASNVIIAKKSDTESGVDKKAEVKTEVAVKGNVDKVSHEPPKKQEEPKKTEPTKPNETKVGTTDKKVVPPTAEKPVSKKDSVTNVKKAADKKLADLSAADSFVIDSVVVDQRLFYTIQIGAKKEPTEKEIMLFMAVPDVQVIKVDDGTKRYAVGYFTNLLASQEVLRQMQGLGFVDAFVTPYYKGKRITMAEAKLIK